MRFGGVDLEHPPGTYEPFSPMLGVGPLAAAWAPERARVLDVGCGVGTHGLVLANLRPDVSILGVDINIDALRAARANAIRNGLPNARFVASSLYSALRPLHFDVLINTLPYEPPETYTMADMAQVPHAYADEDSRFAASLIEGTIQAPMLILYGNSTFEGVLSDLQYEVLSAVPTMWHGMIFVARQRG